MDPRTGEIKDPDCFRNQVAEPDWYQVLRNTVATVSEKASALDFPDDPLVITAIRRAVEALTEVATELVVVEADREINQHQDAIQKQQEFLKAIGRGRITR